MATRANAASTDGRPVTNANFLVDLGLGDPTAPGAGFAEVVVPAMRIDEPRSRAGTASSTGFADGDGATANLILRRGVTGALDLSAWWNRARRGTAPRRRTVTVSLLGPNREVVMRWRFRNARPIALSYAPLRAMDGAVLMETIEIAFDEMEIR